MYSYQVLFLKNINYPAQIGTIRTTQVGCKVTKINVCLDWAYEK